ITLTNTTNIYSSPTINSNSKGALKPQQVSAIAKWNDWYQIKTWLGPLWIKPKDPIIGDIEPVDVTITLTSQTTLFEYPSSSSKKRGALNPQQVSAIAKWNDWYQVKTWLGPLWIKPKDPIIGDIEPVDVTI